MVTQRISIVRVLVGTFSLWLLLSSELGARKFYDDDPLQKVPKPLNVEKALGRALSEYYDFFHHTFFTPGERQPRTKLIPAQEVNTLGEVLDSNWYTNRHYRNPMTLEELARGPGRENPPASGGPLKVISAKTEGVTPGFTIEDERGRRYIVKFDPLTNPEMASAADVISSNFFYALGYHVPENYILYFQPERLTVAPNTTITDADGKHRKMTGQDIAEILLRVPQDPEKGYRAVASLFISGKILGPFRYYGTRSDDPNDVVPHEHRRDLRGLFVFSAWLGHNDAKSLNSLDTLVEEDGLRYVKHYLLDFGATLGSDSFIAKSPRAGNEYLFAWKPAAANFFSLGLYIPRWARADYPHLPAVGNFESDVFEPEKWKANYPNPAFSNRLPDDTFWAAKKVMAFTDEQIRAVVMTGQYSDPAAEKWIADCLIARRNKIGEAFLTKVLPLDRFAVREGRLAFEDLGVKHNLVPSRDYTVQWSRFNNDTEQKAPLAGETALALPRLVVESGEGEYFAAEIHGEDPKKTVTVYLRKKSDRVEVVGIDRTW
ncbi:MAG: hypothetical protein A3H28_14715 [Acidobacteria bacterium RIFCSPLOWO2_02_FULL_61_28]|nr:MAG: hypothetical protein A3H28_14715 [Acidobacteria bacterium RIFCSPLOWO2_02_FULL_61_28]